MKKDILSKYKLIGQLICTQFSEIYEFGNSHFIEIKYDNSDIKKDIKIFDNIAHSIVSDLAKEYISDEELEYRLNSALLITRNYLKHMENCLRLAKENSINRDDKAIVNMNFENLLAFINTLKNTENEIVEYLGE